MSSRRNIILIVLAVLVLYLIGKWAVGTVRPMFLKWAIKRAIGRVEPWPADTNYSDRAWARLIGACQRIQGVEPYIVEAAIREFAGGRKDSTQVLPVHEAQLYLLFKVLFEFPEDSAPVADSGETGLYAPQGQRVSLSWPVDWSGGKPVLMSGVPQTNRLFTMPPEQVFSLLRYKYRYRALDRFGF